MTENPYQSPLHASFPPIASGNVAGRVGFLLSLVGVIGLFLVAAFGFVMAGFFLMLLCLPGIVVSIVGLFRTPRRLAGWGVALGIYVSLHIPTVYLSAFVFGDYVLSGEIRNITVDTNSSVVFYNVYYAVPIYIIAIAIAALLGCFVAVVFALRKLRR